MKKYEFVKLKVKNNVITSATLSEHRGIIEEYASRGYSYKGHIPPLQGASGKIIELDLIFEAEA